MQRLESGVEATQQQFVDGVEPDPGQTLLPRALSPAELALFVSAGALLDVEPGETVFRRGELGRKMYVIETGTIALEFGGDLNDRTLGPSEFFGELALFVGSHTRMGSATALAATRLREIGAKHFERLLACEPALLARFMLRSFSYLVASEQRLIKSLRRRNEELMQTLDSLHCTRGELVVARQLSLVDELTGLANRRGLYHRLEALRSECTPQTQCGLLLVDVDEFKQINDRHGHLAGDRVLQSVADVLRATASAEDLACRLGGDEFALLLVATSGDALAASARALVERIGDGRSGTGHDRPAASVSIGGDLGPADKEWSLRYSHADSALYRVKAEGGNGWSIHRCTHAAVPIPREASEP